MSLLANPYVLVGLLLCMLGMTVGGYRLGHQHATDACAAQKADALVRAIEQANAVAAQDAEVLAAHEQGRERIRTVFQPIRERVTRYVENHAGAAAECLDPDGLRIWRDANAGSVDAASAPKPDYTLPGLAAATLGARGGLAGQPRAGGGAISRLPGTAAGAGGVGEE